MAVGKRISTWFEGTWHDGDIPLLRAADHATWLGTLVFDGARYFDGLVPDLDLHCERIIRSAESMAMNAPITAKEIEELVLERLPDYQKQAVYIRPMMWSTDGGVGMIAPDPAKTAFAICLEDIPMPEVGDFALGVSTFARPRQDMAVTEAKAACLYANNGRILAEAQRNGFNNALSCDVDGNVAETASSNVFMVRDGVVFTPKPNGMFLAGITRLRSIDLLRRDGVEVRETTLTLEDFDDASEIFLTANAAKITPVTRYKDRHMNIGPMAMRGNITNHLLHQTVTSEALGYILHCLDRE